MFGLIKNGIVLSFSCICLLLSAIPTLATFRRKYSAL
jgi:hypothetical protein